MTTFARSTPVTLTPSGAHAVVVDTPDTVAAERGLRQHYRVRLDNGTTRLVAADGLRAVEEARELPFTVSVSPQRGRIRVFLYNEQFAEGVEEHLTEAEVEALVAALQHALAELALADGEEGE